MVQLANALQFMLGPQHIDWQAFGGLPAIAQRWKHPRLAAHCGSKRQFSVCWQHFPTMHWLHGVPPGSSEHEPESIGGVPQLLPLHVRPTQH